MPGHMRTPIALLACLTALVIAAPTQAAPTQAEKRLMVKINNARAAHGLRKLRFGPKLARGADAWSRHLMRRDSFYHARLSPGTGEVLAWGTCAWFSPARAVRMWLRSSGHRRLLLRPSFRFVGPGWTRGNFRGRCAEMAVARFR